MSIVLDQLTKYYHGTPVVNDVSLEIGEGEFFVLLGPSGSGKSTLLRSIAGLSGLDHGRIALHGRDVTHLSARKRGVGLVFQNYALFQHMTVAENIEFALRVRRLRAAERRERRRELLRLMALDGLDGRFPAQLSGGQQQRVAVARALAHKPEVLLLDEPFGALDAKIREGLRTTIRQAQRDLGITTILVTHDQEEAFAMADRIGVMNFGRLLEAGRPHDLYLRPATRFVATFLGAANLLLARQTADGIRCGPRLLSGPRPAPCSGTYEREVVVVVRPEEIELARTETDLTSSSFLCHGTVAETLFTGALERIRVRLAESAATPLLAQPREDGAAYLDATRAQYEQRALQVGFGESVVVGVRRIHVLPTPLSSFTVCAPRQDDAEALAQHPILRDLAARMKTRIGTRIEPNLEAAHGGRATDTPLVGATVIAPAENLSQQALWLLREGAEEILVLPPGAGAPQRVLIHWTGDGARPHTLAVAASVLRHLAAEAVYLDVLPGQDLLRAAPESIRTLLDARSEARSAHGLEMRTERLYGNPAEELAARLRESASQMLILGLDEHESLHGAFAGLLSGASQPLLIVHRSRNAALSRSAA